MKKPLLYICFILLVNGNAFAQTWINYYDSSALFWGKNWEKTSALLTAALPLAEEEIGVEHPNYAVLLNDLGISYWNMGNYSLAKAHLQKSLRLKRAIFGVNDPDYVATLINLGGLFQDLNNVPQAESYYLQVLEAYESSDHKDEYYFTALKSLGELYEFEANYGLAEKQYLSALAYRSTTVGTSNPVYAQVLNKLGNLFRKSGRLSEAEEVFSEAVLIYESKAVSSIEYATVLSNYGLLQAEKGDYGKAELLLNKSRDIVEEKEGKKSKAFATSLNNVGSLYSRMGLKEQAESSYLEALAVYKAISSDNDPELAAPLSNLASYYGSIREYDKALPLFLKAKEIYARQYGTNHPLYGNALNNLASLYRKKGQYIDAEKFYTEALNIEREKLGVKHPQYAASLQNLGLLNIAMGSYKRAAELMQTAIQIKEATIEPQHPSWAATYNNMGLLYFIQDNTAFAAPYFKKGLQNQFHQIKNVFPSLSEGEKEAFYNTLKDDIERFNTFALARYEEDPMITGDMYNNLLVTKGLLFDASNKVRGNIFKSEDQDLVASYNKWRDLREELARAYQLPTEILVNRKINVADIEKNINELEKELSRHSFALNPQKNWQELTWQDIRDKLAPGEAAVEIVRFREFKIEPQANDPADTSTNIATSLLYGWTDNVHYAALIITSDTQDHPQLVQLKGGNELENKYYAYYRNAIRYQVEDKLSYQHFWEEIQQALGNIHTVYFSPDGVYYKINLNTLYLPDPSVYLVDSMNVRQLTSTRDLLSHDSSGNSNQVAFLIGSPDFNFDPGNEITATSKKDTLDGQRELNEEENNPAEVGKANFVERNFSALPGTRAEVEKIALLLEENNWETQQFLDEKAVEESVKNVKNPKVLHIATHGYFDAMQDSVDGVRSENPYFLSGLIFAGAAGNTKSLTGEFVTEDGILTAYEAMNLQLDNTDLVVLSACETGSGSVKNGEGVYGLQRAFQVAGTKSIIFSLWKVNDEATQQLMTYFYEIWMQTGDKRDAFLAAQQRLKSEYEHPYYWGGFIMIGE